MQAGILGLVDANSVSTITMCLHFVYPVFNFKDLGEGNRAYTVPPWVHANQGHPTATTLYAL